MSSKKNQTFKKDRSNVPTSDFANQPLKKKISFFSAMLVVVGSCIGSGIFFKAKSVLEGSQNSIILAMFCWIFVAFGVLCMGLALLEIASVRHDNLSLIGWCKTFNSRLTYKISKNYMFYLYTPIKGFFLPLYLIMAFQDGVASIYIQNGMPYNGFNTSADWAIIMAITIAIATYFIMVCGWSTRIANAQNVLITSVKFIPLVFAAVMGFVIFGMSGGLPSGSPFRPGFNPTSTSTVDALYTFKNLTPGFGFFIAASGILYAYDGFYGGSGIKTEMKEPEKSSSAVLIGLILVTVIYLVIAISMSLGSTAGNPQGLVQFFAQHNILPLFAAFQILIAIGIVGVVNGYNMFATRFVEDLVRDGELPFSNIGAKHLGRGSRIVGSIYILSITIPVIVLFSIIGGLAYINTTDANGVLFSSYANLPDALKNVIDASNTNIVIDGNVIYRYGTGVGSLYTFSDMVSNWSALFIFLFITLAIAGGLNNRKKKTIQVQEFKYFTAVAIASIICISLPIVLTILEPIANLFFLFRIPSDTANYTSNILIPRVMAVVMLFFYIGFAVLPTIIEDRIGIKKCGSIKKYEEEKLAKINLILNQSKGSDSNSI